MSLDIVVPGGKGIMPGFSVRRDPNGLGISAGAMAGAGAIFGIHRQPGAALVNVYPVAPSAGWVVYTFTADSHFTLRSRTRLTADVLLVGGGGSGGGGGYGGGGGGGGFVDRHEFEIVAGENDGTVSVGAGGAEIAWDDGSAGGQGQPSYFGGLEAYGGGYGGRMGGTTIVETAEVTTYDPSDGASGGGSNASHAGTEADPGVYGEAIHNTGLGPDVEQGHDGGPGSFVAPFGYDACGGGGGACWPANGGGDGRSGGLGRVCDIEGFGPYWETSGGTVRIIPWFAGGGAGALRGVWGEVPSYAGYGGGGEVGETGAAGFGGGGGGTSWYGNTSPGWFGTGGWGGKPEGYWHMRAPGKAGGSGRVVIRIRAADERSVAYPVPTGVDGEGQPIYPSGITVKRLGIDQPHTDEMGMEEVAIYAWPSDPSHTHKWGFEDWSPQL